MATLCWLLCEALFCRRGGLTCLFVHAGCWRRKWIFAGMLVVHRQRASLVQLIQRASQTYHTECTTLLHCVTTLIDTVPTYRVRVSQSNMSPLRVYLVMELSHDTAAAAERLYYSTYSRLYRGDTACVSCRDTGWDD